MFADRPCVTLAQAVVESFIVSIIETLLLQGGFEIPIDLSHEKKFGRVLAHALCCLRPEELGGNAPGPLENLGQRQHGHVTTQTVALSSDSDQLCDHCFLCGRVSVVELEGIGPT